jgi:hypothetical protein
MKRKKAPLAERGAFSCFANRPQMERSECEQKAPENVLIGLAKSAML